MKVFFPSIVQSMIFEKKSLGSFLNFYFGPFSFSIIRFSSKVYFIPF